MGDSGFDGAFVDRRISTITQGNAGHVICIDHHLNGWSCAIDQLEGNM
jgi:hypothetical protein